MGTFHEDPVSVAHCFVAGTRPPAGHPGSLWFNPSTGVLQVDTGPAGWVNVDGGTSAGAVADVVADYGATGDGTTDDYMAFRTALDENRRVRVPAGTFRLSATLELGDGPIVLEGDGGWSTRGATTLRFDAGVTGIHIPHANTLGEGFSTDGQWSVVRDLVVTQASKAGTADGILITGRCHLTDVGVSACSRHGININTTSAFGSGNANSFRIDGGRITSCDSDGLFVDGDDSNAGTIVGLDSTSNTGWGVHDSSFLGNSYLGCHVRDNAGGAYTTVGASQQSVLVGCYSEGSQPASDFSPRTLVLGGTHGAGFAHYDFGLIYHATGVLELQSAQVRHKVPGVDTFRQMQVTGVEYRDRLHTDPTGGNAGIRIYHDSDSASYARFESNLIRLVDADGDLRVITIDGDGNLVVT